MALSQWVGVVVGGDRTLGDVLACARTQRLDVGQEGIGVFVRGLGGHFGA